MTSATSLQCATKNALQPASRRTGTAKSAPMPYASALTAAPAAAGRDIASSACQLAASAPESRRRRSVRAGSDFIGEIARRAGRQSPPGDHYAECDNRPGVPQASEHVAARCHYVARDKWQEAAEITRPDVIGDRHGAVADLGREHFGEQRGDGAVCERREHAQHQQQADDAHYV